MNDLTLRAFAALALVLPATGCLSTPAAPRHEFIDPVAPERHTPAGAARPVGIRLANVSASDAARDVLTWRDGAGLLWRDENTRFASAPGDFVRRLAQRRLAAGGELRGRLELDLLYFGASTAGGRTAAEVIVFALLEDRNGVLVLASEYRETVAVESPTAPGRGSAAPLAVALGSAAESVVERVLADADDRLTALEQ
jgi:hypothetical protein